MSRGIFSLLLVGGVVGAAEALELALHPVVTDEEDDESGEPEDDRNQVEEDVPPVSCPGCVVSLDEVSHDGEEDSHDEEDDCERPGAHFSSLD